MKVLALLYILQSLLLSLANAAQEASFPSLEGETLDKKSISLPADFHAKTAWMIIGFTKGSQKATSQCSENLENTFKNQGYTIAILQGAPFFLKGIIKNGIRSSVPEGRRERYLILSGGRDELKHLTEFDEASKDDAYILGIRPKSNAEYDVAFKSHGVCDEAHLSIVTKMIRDLTSLK